MNPTTATLTADGRISIPPELLAEANLQAGDVRLELSSTGILIRPPSKPVDIERMRSVIGRWKDRLPDMTVDQWLEEMRGPVELPPDDGVPRDDNGRR